MERKGPCQGSHLKYQQRQQLKEHLWCVLNLVNVQFMRKSNIHGWICWPVPTPIQLFQLDSLKKQRHIKIINKKERENTVYPVVKT